MNTRHRAWLAAIALAACALGVSTAAAAPAQRTFVASYGLDSSPTCSLAAPCRTFAAALAQTNPGGEVIVLDSAGYGVVQILQSVSIIAPAGIHAGVSVFSGDGFAINAGPGDAVVLRGLTLTGMGGASAVSFAGGNRLSIEHCVITGAFANGIFFAPTAADHHLAVQDTLVRNIPWGEINTGLRYSPATGVVPAAGSGLTVLRSTFDHAGRTAVMLVSADRGTLADTVVTGSVTAIAVSGATAPRSPMLTLDTVRAVGNGNGLLVVGAFRQPAYVTVSRGDFSNNASYGVLANDYGTVRLEGTIVTGNGTGIGETGAGAVESLGNNMIAGNTLDLGVGVTLSPIAPR